MAEQKTTRKYTPKKNYIVLVMGGHAGRGYGVPFLHFVTVDFEDNLSKKLIEERVINAALNIPRVKHDQDASVIGFVECTRFEGALVQFINDYNPYLTSSKISAKDCKELKIKTAYATTIMMDAFRGRGRSMPEIFKNLMKIRVASDFSDDYPIQQSCAPSWVFSKTLPKDVDEKNLSDQEIMDYYQKFGRLDYPKVDMRKLLKKVFTQSVKKYAMVEIEEPQSVKEIRRAIEVGDPEVLCDNKKIKELKEFEYDILRRTQMLMLYCRLFGKDNPLSIRYNGRSHTMTYPSQTSPSKIVTVPIPNIPYVIVRERMSEIKLPDSFKTEKDKTGFERHINESLEQHLMGDIGQFYEKPPIYAEKTYEK